jgi:hypothetical protein
MDEHFLCQGSRDISVDIVIRLHVRRTRIRISLGGKAEDSYRAWAPLSLLFSRYLGFWGRDSSVGIATQYRLDVPGIESRWGEIYRTRSDRSRYTPSLQYNGFRVFPGSKTVGA